MLEVTVMIPLCPRNLTKRNFLPILTIATGGHESSPIPELRFGDTSLDCEL